MVVLVSRNPFSVSCEGTRVVTVVSNNHKIIEGKKSSNSVCPGGITRNRMKHSVQYDCFYDCIKL